MAFLYNYVTFPIFIFNETTGITYDDPTFCCSASFAFLLPPPLEPDALLPPGGGFFFPGLLFMLVGKWGKTKETMMVSLYPCWEGQKRIEDLRIVNDVLVHHCI